LEKAVAQWALESAGGNISEFPSHYEFARARFGAWRKQEAERLKGTANLHELAAVAAGKMMSAESLTAELARETASVKARPTGQHLSGTTAGRTPLEVAKAVQNLDRVNFKSPATEVYHAWKHASKVPPEIPYGSLVDRYYAASIDTVRTGRIVLATDYPPPQTGTRVVIHKLYGENLAFWREAILHVGEDGTVTLASWGDCKAVNPKTVQP